MGLLFTIFSIVLLLLVEIFFSGSEIALVVTDKVRLKTGADRGSGGSMSAMWFIRHPAHFFSTVILGTNIAVVAASTIATFFLIANFGESAEMWALLLSPVVLVFGEVLPKSLFQHYADRLVEKISPPLMFSMYALFPFVWLLSRFTNFLLGGVTHHLGSEPRLTREELALLIGSSDLPDVRPSEKKMVTKILELANQRVENVMVPLALVESTPLTTSRDGALEIFDLKGFSKLPVFEHRAYNIIGVIDCLDCLFSDEKDIKGLVRPVPYVPRFMLLHELYLLMKEREEQTVIVVDEYGAAVGLVTLEDILEEIVGDIKDEYELGRQHWRSMAPGRFLLAGQIEIEEANEKLGLDIPRGNYETVAGFLLDKFGYIPSIGQSLQIGPWRYTIKKATERAIIEIEVVKS